MNIGSKKIAARRLGTMIILAVLPWLAPAQDVLNLGDANGVAGQPVDVPLYIQDVPGTLIDTNFPMDGFFGFVVKIFFNDDLVDDIEFLRGGVTESSSPLIFLDLSDQQPGVAVVVCSYNPDPIPVMLNPPQPGDLVAFLRVTPSAQADGQTISFTNDDIGTSLSGFNGIPELTVDNGNLTFNLGSITVGAGGGDLPVIQSFEINPSTIPQGEQAIISWHVVDADTVSIDQGIGNVGPIGNGILAPFETTTYTLTATNAAGSVQQSATLTVTAANTPTIHFFNVNPASIQLGEQATLAWFVSEADSVSIDQGIGAVAPESMATVMPTETTTYTLTATNAFGSVQQPVTLSVTQGVPPVIQSFTVSPGTIPPGGSATLFWIVDGAGTVSIDNGVGPVNPSGSTTVRPNNDTTYTLSATNTFGGDQASVSVMVSSQPVPQILSFSADPNQLIQGDSSTLSWQVQDADTVDISGGVGRVAHNSSFQVSPEEDTEYLLLAGNAAGQNTATVEVLVVPRTEIIQFEVSPNQIALGETATLSWEVANPENVSLNPGNQSVNASGSTQVQPTATTTYTLTATGPLNQMVQNAVELRVTGEPSLGLSTSSVHFGEGQETMEIQLLSNTQTSANWQVQGLPDWLALDPGTGEVDAGNPATLNLTVDRTVLFPGQAQEAEVTFAAPGLQPTTLNVSASRPEQNDEYYLYYPLVEGNETKTSDIAVVNLSPFAVEVLLQVFEKNGELARDPETVRLESRAGFRSAVVDLEGGQGWAVASLRGADGQTQDLAGAGYANIRATDGEELVTLSAVAQKSDFLYVPHVARDVANFFTTSSVVNLASQNRDLALDIGNDTGIPVQELASGGQEYFDYAALLGAIPEPNWGRLTYAPAQSNSMVGAEVFGLTEATGVRQTVGVGLGQNTSNALYFVHIAQDLASFWTGIVVIHLGSQTSDVVFEPYNAQGELIEGGFTLPFEPNEKKTFLVSGDRLDFGEGATWVKVSSGAPLIGYELFGTHPPGDQFAGFENIDTLSNQLAILHLEDALAEGGYTGISIVNPGDQNADLTLRLVAADGTVKETNRNESVAPKAKLVTLASALFESVIAPGDIILVESSEKLAGFELYGAGTKTMGALTAWSYGSPQQD